MTKELADAAHYIRVGEESAVPEEMFQDIATLQEMTSRLVSSLVTR